MKHSVDSEYSFRPDTNTDTESPFFLPEDLTNTYRSILNVAETPDQAIMHASYITDQLWQRYSKDNPEDILRVIEESLTDDITNNPLFNNQGKEIIGKKQPSFMESVKETIKRQRFLNEYLPQLPEPIRGAIVGGSMSYGRFFNVRGGYPNSSDLDIILITDGPLTLDSSEQIANTQLGFDENERDQFKSRLRIFEEGYNNGTMDVFSHKFSLPENEFDVSIHAIPEDTFENIFDKYLSLDLERQVEIDWRLRDYKPNPFRHRVTEQRDFNGNTHAFVVQETIVERGVISTIPGYAIKKDHFVPGMYHNLASPRFEVALDRSSINTTIDKFKELMEKHEDMLRSLYHDRTASLPKSHLRSDIFSPYLVREFDKNSNIIYIHDK